MNEKDGVDSPRDEALHALRNTYYSARNTFGGVTVCCVLSAVLTLICFPYAFRADGQGFFFFLLLTMGLFVAALYAARWYQTTKEAVEHVLEIPDEAIHRGSSAEEILKAFVKPRKKATRASLLAKLYRELHRPTDQTPAED